MSSEIKGRLGAPADEVYQDTVARKSAQQGILIKMDELIDAIQALTAKLDADAGVTDTDYAATISDAISKVLLKG